MEWTPPQKEAIEYDGNRNILVAAAAGSGKTAVLVERIIQKILDEKEPLSADEILVLTFTEAAAKEMKNKISSAIEKKLKEHPDNKHLQKQSRRIDSADISTIHSFAKKIIENNIHLTDIPTDFRIIDTAENTFLLNDALNSCLERYYARFDKIKPFADLAIGYGGIKNDNSLREAILKLYETSQSMSQPVKWLNSAAKNYKDVCTNQTVENTVWADVYMKCVHHHINYILGYYDTMKDIIDDHIGYDENLLIFIKNERNEIEQIKKFRDISTCMESLHSFKFGTKPRAPRCSEETKYLHSQIAEIRNLAKSEFSKPGFMKFDSIESTSETLIELYPRIKTLKNIVLMLIRKHKKMKLKDSYLDFNDLEHELINLLMNNDGSPTELCKKLSKKYREIFVDEYQDTNNLQDTLFSLVSNNKKNIFMVGDIKQSIYSFRNALPELFLDKYQNYGKKNNDGKLIRLSNNFRSRKDVVDSVNFVFSQIMHSDNADIDYTEDEYLHQSAVFPDSHNENSYATELMLTDVSENNLKSQIASTSNTTKKNQKREIEAEIIAKRILRLVYRDNFMVTDKETGQLRPVDFGDIVILYRSGKNTVQSFQEVFEKYGIPFNVSSDSGFLDSLEVKTMIAFLEIIDNPLRDIPLVAVMRSPMFGFTADELAEIRTQKRHGYFFDAVCASAKNGNQKSKHFLDTLNDLRKKSEYMGIDKLIYNIYTEFDYISAVDAKINGEGQVANLKLLLERASNFEKTEHNGLFGFVNYLNLCEENGIELSQNKSTAQKSAVSMTTIHKSKGLEYPVVILAHTSSSSSSSGSFAFHSSLGIGISYVNTDTRIKYPSLTMELIKYINKNKETAEEIRLLYVALTRAKEKLIISCTNEGASKQWLKPQLSKNKKIAPVYIKSTSIFRDWLVYAFLNHADAEPLRDIIQSDISELVPHEHGGLFKFENTSQNVQNAFVNPKTQFESELYELSKNENIDKEDINNRIDNIRNNDNDDCKTENDDDLFNEFILKSTKDSSQSITEDELDEVLDYKYPYEKLTKVPLKLSVSEIKERMTKSNNEENGYTPRLGSVSDKSFNTPGKTAADNGTITHYFIQHINPMDTESEQAVNLQMQKMKANGILSDEQCENIDISSVYDFFSTSLGHRMKEASEKNMLKREFKFLIPLNGEEVYSELGDENTLPENTNKNIIVQGIVDCFFFENDEIILIDFKTDKSTPSNAAEKAKKYKIQVDLYAKALEMIFKKKVKEKIIYFTKSKTAVRV